MEHFKILIYSFDEFLYDYISSEEQKNNIRLIVILIQTSSMIDSFRRFELTSFE